MDNGPEPLVHGDVNLLPTSSSPLTTTLSMPMRFSDEMADSPQPTQTRGSAADSNSQSPDPSAIIPRRKRKPIPGKGYRKSRNGCFSCKRRRIKCSEARPSCRGCLRMGLECLYPDRRMEFDDTPQDEAMPLSLKPITEARVDLDHLRFFQHFLTAAYPAQPYGSAAVWHNVAALSHEYEFLANALLGLGAQHLVRFHKRDYQAQALNLRIAAIKGLNEALSLPCRSPADADARYAAIVTLTYQSSYMPDAMMDFVVMLRGWMLIQNKLLPDLAASMFHDFTRESYTASMRTRVQDSLSQQNPSVLEDFMASLKMVRSLCRSTGEKEYLSALEKVARAAVQSPMQGFLELVPCYAQTNKMDENDFRVFTNPANGTGRVLLAHLFMLDYALELHFLCSSAPRFAFSREITAAWVLDAARRLPSTYDHCMMWPVAMAASCARGHASGDTSSTHAPLASGYGSVPHHHPNGDAAQLLECGLAER